MFLILGFFVLEKPLKLVLKSFMLSDVQIQRMARNLIERLEQNKISNFLAKKEKAVSLAINVVKSNFEEEKKIDLEAHKLVDKLIQNSNDQTLNRHTMFKMAKKRLADKVGFVL